MSLKLDCRNLKDLHGIGVEFHHFNHFPLYLSFTGVVAIFCNFSRDISGLGFLLKSMLIANQQDHHYKQRTCYI